MDLSWESEQLITEKSSVLNLPQEVLVLLREGSNVQYLNALSALALDPAHTIAIFLTHEPAFVEICSRWLALPDENCLSALQALARILPSAPHVSVYAKALLRQKRKGPLEALASRRGTALHGIPIGELHSLLLALCRLLTFNNEEFAEIVTPVQLQVLLKHDDLHIRYLAIKNLCLYLHASDAVMSSMIKSYIGEDEIAGPWEDKIIDYTFFSLWEDKRLKDIARNIEKARATRLAFRTGGAASAVKRHVTLSDLSSTTACIGGVMVPRLDEANPPHSTLVMTGTVVRNLRVFADGLNDSRPLLISGSSGAGKTSLIRHVAQELGKSSSMLTLHLNEQTDAKLLIGMYTNAKTPGSFSWRPGVLTKAVMEGRWVVIEDLNRAPMEIISALLPLLERRELLIPNWGECIRAAPGFKLIATMRSTFNADGEEVLPTANILGIRQWLRVPFQTPSQEELAEIIKVRFPILRAFIPRFMKVYSTLEANFSKNSNLAAPSSITKPFGSRDLLRWCGRVETLLLVAGILSEQEPISEALNDSIFLEAVDCFLGAFTSGPSKCQGVEIVAQQLHLPAERIEYCLETRRPRYECEGTKLQIGRASLSKQKRPHYTKPPYSPINASPFAMTNHVLRILEAVAVAVRQGEPCLLVGETGTGKTTIVQRLADALEQKLTVVNLSQQSEAGDLLGGYKPVNMRALALPMKEEFDRLLELTFPSKRNQHYIETIGKSIARGRWERALNLWQEALRTIEARLKPTDPQSQSDVPEPHAKKRKLQSFKIQALKSNWDVFASKVQTFQIHLASGSHGFAFSFIEGNIIKAARNGEWVLLDEINLASPDTLESLADLFRETTDGGPSVILTDTGDAERIQAHKDFRIFGAMNPATDFGKRDLPASLRSRFTELFVEAPDKDLENLIPVVKAYLGTHVHTDLHAATDVAGLYLEIKKLADENKLVDGANQKPHFSLRTLTRTLTYVIEISPIYGLRRALFEGFSMSFLTLLNKDSELWLEPLIYQHIMGAQKNSQASLRQIPRLPHGGKRYVQFRHYWIAQGAATVEQVPYYIITPFIERNLLNLVRATSTRRFPVLLQGPTSSGKTSMIEYLARISGNKFVRINNHEHTDLQEYLGTYISGPDGRLQYQEGVLVQALREGYWVILDELNLAPTDVLEALNRLLDDNRELLVPETQQVVRPHENFMLFATQNPPGMYGGRKMLSRAFRNRFLELHFDDIPDDELETILRERSQIAPSFCTKIVSVYKKLSILRQSERLFEQKNSFATLRDLFRWALRDADDREKLAINGFLLLAERVRNAEERNAVKKVIEEVMKVQINESQIYSWNRMESSLTSSISSHRDIVWTKSMRRLYVLVTEALKNDEPVLLIGETGSGKTTVCQVIAKMINTKLHIVNAHQKMETGDLIGSQRPVRNRDLAKEQLSQELIAVLKSCDAFAAEAEYDIATLERAYEELQGQNPAILSHATRIRVEQAKIRANALFEWADSSLVHAMANGEHFLLDEISLADDSVLERLNSVLEPSRTLFLAEKGPNDAIVKALPGFQFLATMNPGGDYGKRELSPALRNRFTEIWVPHASDKGEILEIAQAKLTLELLEFAQPMIEFAAWYAATFNPAAPYISIRDLLSWIDFANAFHVPNSFSALFHGAAMVYIDCLGANPASKMVIAEIAVPQQRQVCFLKLDALFGQSLSTSYGDEAPQLSITTDTFAVGSFRLSRSSDVSPDPRYSLKAPTAMANCMKLMRALQLRKPVLLEGSPGVGKTTLVAALAHFIGAPLTRINLSDQTDLMDLFGSDIPIESEKAGHFSWRDAPFLRAMQKGEWVLLDEMNLASQSVLEGLNACLDHRGQVYIPELGQTFEKHPNFVVFAAQNPHHQGGGRKGLPASFIDRFTVVYAEAFIPEDLLMIASDVYPDFPVHDTQKLTECVTALSELLRRSFRVGASGGPWEINLRDILRWLHLLTARDGLMPLADPAYYRPLLFQQRFRTSDDVTIVSKTLQEHLPVTQSYNYFHGKSDTVLEIGLGVLARDKMLQTASSSRLRTARYNLPILESVMVCLQNDWPCLLVGPSGSGKTNLISQLANSLGAEVLALSLNPDMDTMDLIGGYEQKNPERDLTAYQKKLQNYTQRALIEQLTSVADLNENLIKLEAKLRGTVSDVLAAVQLIQDLALEYPLSRYVDFLSEYKHLVRYATIDNGARFEWVDGILVKALKQGKWLVLDNANLCSSAVLDRLNSLLEPNGFLSINEHRNPDGSAQVVKPHPRFRLFITIDPRHGEVSQAMRNRSIELFMHAESPSPTVNVLDSCFESTVSRFQMFQMIDWPNLGEHRFKEMLAIFFDHLAFPDLRLTRRWWLQVARGLGDLSHSEQAWFSCVANAYEQMSRSDGSILCGIRNVYSKIGHDLALTPDFNAMQTIHPFNNPILHSRKACSVWSSNLCWHGLAFELLVAISCFGQNLALVSDGTQSKSTAEMSRLELSFASSKSRTFVHDSTQPIAHFLQSMGGFLRNMLEADFGDSGSEQDALFAHNVFSYLIDLFDLSHFSSFDEGKFQAYQTLGKSLCSGANVNGPLKNLTARLASELGSKLDSFNDSWQLKSGLGMELLWTNFRPVCAMDLEHLESSNQVKDLATRFDAMRWSSGTSIHDLCSLQGSMVRMHDAIRLSSSVNFRISEAQDIQKAVEGLESHFDIVESKFSPYLEPHFEMLCQYKTCAEDAESLASNMELELLAGRSTARLMKFGISSNAWEALSRIQSATATGLPDLELAPIRRILPISMLHMLKNVNEVSLQRLELLCVEIGSISRTVARLSATINSDPLQNLEHLLLRVQKMVHKALESQVDMPSLKEIKEALDRLLLRSSKIQKNVNETTQHLYRSLESVYVRQQPGIPMTPSEQYQGLEHCSIDCIQFFTGCLLLYVPDRPYDPALKPIVERDRHVKRRFELENKLQALQDFELIFSGQKSSLRSQLVERRIAELGDAPVIPMIPRPQISELGQLQAEFSSIMTGIVLKSPTSRVLRSIFRQDSAAVQEMELLRTNIAQAISRLSGGFRAYEDVTKPLIGFLQGFDVGLALSLLVGDQCHPQDQTLQYLCEMTPFLGATPQGITRIRVNDLDLHRLHNIDPRLHFLRCATVLREISRYRDRSIMETTLQLLDNFYQEWKERLARDQRLHTAQSSLYRYRGSEDESIEADEQEFHRLFPDYDRAHERVESHEPAYDARDRAQKVAALQRQIFSSKEIGSERLLELLQDASEDVARCWNDSLKTSKCPIPAENLFSALVLNLDQHKERLLAQSQSDTLYNFYNDANLFEVHRLIAIVQKIQARFLDLRQAWPEHATLTDVLRTSSELLTLRHTEPIAKVLTKTEQLHAYIYEWQIVASQQYTAATLYNQLTDLLISWRRLELSTWARLLDMEDQTCSKDADSWWFLAYEVIVAVPLSMINAGQSLHLHVEQLFSTLEDFVRTTSIGQYANRLVIINCFKFHLQVLAQTVPSISAVHFAITNFLSYYARFESRIHDYLRKGRQKLEKDMREILQLASWKDTNINALRDSAKRSHHKLFKVIRKYRGLLAQSAETFLTQGFPIIPAMSKQRNNFIDATKIDPRVIQTCERHLENWESKSERFKNPILTAQRMIQVMRQVRGTVECVSYLDEFGNDLVESIRNLQKETLSKASKADSKLGKHLKARKRKLYTDTLKALRHMGFRSNMSAEELSRQSSLSIVLANTPVIDTSSHPLMSSAEFHFHQILRIMPEIKDRARNHSEDINPGEVSRSMGYLESILSNILKQRTVLATTTAGLQKLDETVKAMSYLWAPDSYTLKKRDVKQQNRHKEVQHVFEWLPELLEAGSVIIKKHGKMGEIDHSKILTDLEVWKDKIIAANTTMGDLPKLPSNVTSSQHMETYHDASELLDNFRSSLQQLIDATPGVAFVLKQIAKWTGVDIATDDAQTNGQQAKNLEDLDESVSKAMNSILIAVQRMQEASSTVPCSFEEPKWLMRAESSFAISLQNSYLQEIEKLLQEAVGEVQYLDAADDGDISAAGAVFALAFPIIQQFGSIVQNSCNRYAELHQALCKLADHLAHSFSQVLQEGFCSPAEDSAAEAGSDEKVEGGTGLGEGEGAEDISKDIQDDEDLSELAQSMEKDEEKGDIEDQKDAVNMDQDELEGEMGDVSDQSGNDESADEGEENDLDEETRNVDSLDPTAVDEKLWDGKAGETGRDKEGPGTEESVEKDDQVAADANRKRDSAQDREGEEEEKDGDDEANESGVDEAEDVTRGETEKLDPHLQEGQNLDLPTEMDLDNMDGTEEESASGDSDMRGMSDIEQEDAEKEAGDISDSSTVDESEENMATDVDNQDQLEKNAKDDTDTNIYGAEDVGSPADTETDAEERADDHGLAKDSTNNQDADQANSAAGDGTGLEQDSPQTDNKKPITENSAQGKDGDQVNDMNADDPEARVEDSQHQEMGGATGTRSSDSFHDNFNNQAFKKLGDALEKWHRQNRQIQEASEREASAQPKTDLDTNNQDFEHLHDEEVEGDTQALGTASDDQARALDKNAMDSEVAHEKDSVLPLEDKDEEGATQYHGSQQEEKQAQIQSDQYQKQSRLGAFVANGNDPNQRNNEYNTTPSGKEEDIDELHKDLSTTHLGQAFESSLRSLEDARRLWLHYESLTRNLSLTLTEQLRLILAPTLATKMRGDFRTGKRLNVKRIIPYIASQYKRDKIWMRRSVPSKRNYQIMLAVDDSKSMDESGSGRLAFEALALVSKTLSMLEVGEICVLGFGNEVRVAHEFDQPFTSDAGPQVFQHFSFQQHKTNVRQLVATSVTLFREARRKSFNAGTELWQLELIISDGVCEDHDSIRRLVRQAQEERIMIVFVIVDALLKEESIMDMSQAVFEPDATGETRLKIKRYLDGFPFPYYLVVGDVKELPGVLAQALRQWFAEVVESG